MDTTHPIISNVALEFFHHQRYYAVFTVDAITSMFLYFHHTRERLFSVLFGDFTLHQIRQLQERDPPVCIECELGLKFEGGVSHDGNETVEFGMTALEANRIIQSLELKISKGLPLLRFGE